MTPAQQKGLIVGKQYTIVSGYQDGHSFPTGSVVTFTEDDGTNCPRFDGPSDDGDGYDYPYLDNIGMELAPGASDDVTFEDKEITVPVGITVITVKRRLSAKEREAIINIIKGE